MNTAFSLAAATVATFVVAPYYNHTGKYRMVDVQNATLAGGVAMGACADLHIGAASAIAIGAAAATGSARAQCRVRARIILYQCTDMFVFGPFLL